MIVIPLRVGAHQRGAAHMRDRMSAVPNQRRRFGNARKPSLL